MKRWAVLTVLLYTLALIVLTAPVMLVAFGGWARSSISLRSILQTYSAWGYWLWLVVLVGGQALLLLLPLKIAERRLPARRPLKIPVIVSAFFLANLFIAGIFAILCAAFRDHAFDWLSLFDLSTAFNAQPVNANNPGWGAFWGLVFTMVCFWIIWAIVFRNFASSDEPDALLKRITRWLLRGSILELLIAVPSHVIVRRRDDCCAPAGTFWGIATGISIMLLCFGPGVFFLFVERFNRLKPKQADTAGATAK
ncbi:MAG TPA: hypothetical protein VN784_02595 [Candidatus Limnocylindrales bacterium]|nr:hypothetical protein [Candidatus Limnocylindrales bacterium]